MNNQPHKYINPILKPSEKRAQERARYGEDVVEVLEEAPNPDWEDVRAFSRSVGLGDY